MTARDDRAEALRADQDDPPPWSDAHGRLAIDGTYWLAEAYRWHVTVRAGAFHDTGGAPTAGTDDTATPNRWRFQTDDKEAT